MTRVELEKLYDKHWSQQSPTGGVPFSLDDHLHQIRLAAKFQMTPAQLANRMGCPIDYVMACIDHLNAPQ